QAPVRCELDLALSGTATLAVAPVAGQTRMALAASWPHPSFGGRFLPLTRDVRDTQFSANWDVSSLATKAPVDFARGTALCEPAAETDADTTPRNAAQLTKDTACVEVFSVSFIDPINPYSLSDRAIKYGILFVG